MCKSFVIAIPISKGTHQELTVLCETTAIKLLQYSITDCI